MTELAETSVGCPYCGESLSVLLDPQEAGQEYVEDCQVCCKPIVFRVSFDGMGDLQVSVHDENDTY